MRRFVSLVCLIWVVTACDGNPEIGIEKNAKQQFAVLPGKIGVTLKNALGEWHHIIRQGELIKVDSLPKALPEAATILSKSFDSPAGLPPQEGYVYWGPYLPSPNKRYIAASMAVERHAAGSPGFVVVDTKVNKTVAILKGNENCSIKSLAWSPDSKWVAVLKASSELSALDRFVISLTGHADPTMIWYLEVVNLAGDVVAHSKLTELRGSWGWVVWME
jgi:hypothetical protein